MTKTQNYQLNQWDAGDRVLREDFNADNQNTEKALDALQNAMPKIYFGSYKGTGKYGSENPNKLTFPFQPKLVLISNSQAMGSRKNVVGWFYGYTQGASDNDSNTSSVFLTWHGSSLSWYSTDSDQQQINQIGVTYYYCAIG